MEGQKQPAITGQKPGELITLRITAKKAKNLNRDGSIHGFSLLRAKDRKPVQDWDFSSQAGDSGIHSGCLRASPENILWCARLSAARIMKDEHEIRRDAVTRRQIRAGSRVFEEVTTDDNKKNGSDPGGRTFGGYDRKLSGRAPAGMKRPFKGEIADTTVRAERALAQPVAQGK